MNKWLIFIKERFPPLQYLPMILFFFLANTNLASSSLPLPLPLPLWNGIGAFVVTLLIFLHLRIFDEIKDYEIDKKINPLRPLARNLISVGEAKRAAFGLIAFELILSLLIGIPAFLAACCAVGYSLLMYKEFFVGSWLRPKLSTYALTHTLVVCWISLFLFSAATGRFFSFAPGEYWLFAIANWMIFNVFEFGRKTFGKKEERQEVDSYSKKFGSWGASAIVLMMAAAAIAIAFKIGSNWSLLLAILSLILFAAGLLYAISNDSPSAKRFRYASSAYIFSYYLVLTL